ncbi:MAG: hypothetical protein ACRCST_03480 [Turicibacter sp.]
MNKTQLNESIESIKPTQEQKERMLKNILTTNPPHQKRATILSYQVKPLLYLSASVVILIGIGFNLNLNHQNITSPPVSSSPELPFEQPKDLHNIITYKGYRYTILENVSQKIDTLSLTNVLETIHVKDNIGLDLDEISTNEQDIMIWESDNYHPDYRIVIQQGDAYYLCENSEQSLWK